VKITKELIWQFVFLTLSGVFAIYLYNAGIPGNVSAALGDAEGDEVPPATTTAIDPVVNTTPGVNQTYNIPNQPTVQQPSSDADYLSADQVNAQLAPQADSVVQNVLSVGAQYSEFVPANESLEG
jgi:hypothetical protein